MSNITYSAREISEIASALYKEFGTDFFDTYQDKMIAIAEAESERRTFKDEPKKARDELSIRLDNFRWAFETIALANKLESFSTYNKYGSSGEITYDEIEIHLQTEISMIDLLDKVKLLNYNSSKFLNKEVLSLLERFESNLSSRIIQLGEKN